MIKRAAYETARLKLAHVQLASGQCLATGYGLITQTAAEALEVDRVGIWFLRDQDRELVCEDQFARASRQHTSGQVLHAREYPTYMRALTERRAIVVDRAKTHPATAELATSYLIPNRIESMLDAPIIRGDRVVGIVCHERLHVAKAWTQREIDFAGSVADITALMLEQADRVELEAALKIQTEETLHQQKLEALALLARSVAHDLNNVLSVFLVAASEVQDSGLTEVAESISAAVEAGRNLSMRLFEVGGRRAPEATSTDLGKVINRLQTALRSIATRRVRLNIDVQDRKPRVRMTEGDIERIVINLVANARDAIDGEGSVNVVVRSPEAGDDVPPDFLILEVIDDGRGMDARARAHLFEPYFTTKPDGHGLGLATLYGIVRRAGGNVEVASEPRRGTSFRISLPRGSD
jgi:two-component system, cell cycle sensor histidine kinase and response regulator CckA